MKLPVKNHWILNKRLLYLVFAFIPCFSIFGSEKQQDTIFTDNQPTNSSTLIGVGNISLYDTYLSILEYKGTAFRLMNEKRRNTNLFGKKFSIQRTASVELGSTKSLSKNATEYSLLGDFSIGGHHKFFQTQDFRFFAGGLWNTAIGVLYNERNMNNPVSVRTYSNLQASVLMFYNWKNLTFRWQLDAPVVGLLFSPEFGQSYYDISLGNSSKVLYFASLHNQRALRNYLTVDFPIRNVTFRVGYLGNYYQTKVNDLQTHNYSNTLMIGLVKESLNFSGSKIKKSKINSSYY